MKVVVVVVIVLQVIVFGNLISQSSCFNNPTCMNTALTFSGSLFLSISICHILPDAFAYVSKAVEISYHSQQSQSLMSGTVPIPSLIAMATFMLVLFIDKILISASHSH